MKFRGLLALVVVALAAAANARQLDDLDSIRDVNVLSVEDIVPRLLQELGMGDGPTPGAYAQSSAPMTTPGAYASSATVLEEATNPSAAAAAAAGKEEEEEAEEEGVEAETPETTTPAAAETAEPADTPAAAAAATPAGTCPSGSSKVSYTAGTLYCVLSSPTADQGEVYVAMAGQNGNKIAVPTDNTCYSAACVETIDALKATTTSSTMVGGTNRKLKAVQGAEVAPFLVEVEETTTTPTKLSHSKCFYVCETQQSGPMTVVRPKDSEGN